MNRYISWFSCGATSAVATMIALNKYDDLNIVYVDTGSEHSDNKRFIKDCEKWYGQEIQVLKSPHYNDIWDVFTKHNYLAGVHGARCTLELKKKVRMEFENLETDIQIFGFDADERARAERFNQNNPLVKTEFPLIDEGLTKNDCFAVLLGAKIDLPAMYLMGYNNNNCIGCVKGQQGYWAKIRKDFPDVFERMAKEERRLNAAINKTYAGDGERKRLFLDELPEDIKPVDNRIQCGLFCPTELK